MRLTARHTHGGLSKAFTESFRRHAALFADQIKMDALKLEFSDRHEVFMFENGAVIQIDPWDPLFQDADTIDPFICQEIVRIKTRRKLCVPRFIEDVICGREAAELYPEKYFQLCYLGLLKYRQLKDLWEFIEANKQWIIFFPLDAYNSEFLSAAAKKIRHEKRLDILCRPLFDAAKSDLSSSEKLNNATEAYEQVTKYAGG